MGDIRPFETLAQNEDVTGLLEEVAARIAALANIVAVFSPDVAGRLRVNAELVANITTVGTVTNVGTVGNQANIGGYAANQQILALTHMAENALRQNIVIS